jgi:hypothetical protein
MRGEASVAKRLYVWLVVAAVAAVAVLVVVMRSSLKQYVPQDNSLSPETLTVAIDQQTFTMKDGVAELPAAPGSPAHNTLRIVGAPVSGDVNADGKDDTALILRNDPGGSGSFYYAVVAINDGTRYHASNALALGDRIAPQSIDFADGRFVYRFLERKPGEPMAARPSVPTTLVVTVDPDSDRISAVS